MMDVLTTTGAVRRANLLSNRHHQQTKTQLLTGLIPFLSLNQQHQIIDGSPLAEKSNEDN